MEEIDSIVSWVTVNDYSKTLDLLIFAAAVFGPPAILYLLLSKVPSFSDALRARVIEASDSFSEKRWNVLTIFLQWVLVPSGLYYLLYQPGLSGFLDLYHEGERLTPVHMYTQGARPYVEIYLQHGLIRNLLLPLAATELFGTTVEAVRALHHILEPIPYLLLYAIGLLVFRGRFITSIALVLICSSVEYWIGLRQGLMLTVLITHLLWIRQLSFGKEHEGLLFLSGAFSAFAFWFSIDYGLYSVFCCLVSLVSLRLFSNIRFKCRRSIISYLFGLFAFSFPILLWIAANGALPAFYENVFHQLVYQLPAWGLPFPKLDFSEGLLGRIPRMYYSILVLIVANSVLAWRIYRRRLFSSLANVNFFVVLLFALVCFRTALGRSDYGHWIDGSTLIWILCFFAFDFALFARGLPRIFPIAGILFAGAFFFALEKVHQPVAVLQSRIEQRVIKPKRFRELPVKVARVGAIALPEQQERAIKGVVDYIQKNTAEGDYIYDFANQAAYYFLVNRPSPTRFFNVSYALTDSMQREVVRDLESKRPKIVISSTGTIFDGIDGIPSSKRHKLIYGYLQRHYEFAIQFEETKLLKRK